MSCMGRYLLILLWFAMEYLLLSIDMMMTAQITPNLANNITSKCMFSSRHCDNTHIYMVDSDAVTMVVSSLCYQFMQVIHTSVSPV